MVVSVASSAFSRGPATFLAPRVAGLYPVLSHRVRARREPVRDKGEAHDEEARHGILMSTSQFPEQGILWRGWDDETLTAIEGKKRPVLLFVADPHAPVWPFLKEILKEMPANARLRALLHEFYPPLFIKADAVPEELTMLGAGSRYHIAVLSPYGFTPMITIDPMGGSPSEIVNEIVVILEGLVDVWRD